MKIIILISLLFVAFSAFAQSNTTYLYDNLNRVTAVQYSNGTTVIYTYDEVGNRTSEIITSSVCASPKETLKSGNWDDPTVWNCGSLPITTDNVRINTGHIITVLTGVTALFLNLELNGNIVASVGSNIQLKGN